MDPKEQGYACNGDGVDSEDNGQREFFFDYTSGHGNVDDNVNSGYDTDADPDCDDESCFESDSEVDLEDDDHGDDDHGDGDHGDDDHGDDDHGDDDHGDDDHGADEHGDENVDPKTFDIQEILDRASSIDMDDEDAVEQLISSALNPDQRERMEINQEDVDRLLSQLPKNTKGRK